MTIRLDHTIVAARDGETSARWFTEVFGLGDPEPVGHFWQVATANGVDLDFDTWGGDSFDEQHYAFRVDEDDFDAIFGRVLERGIEHWADPGRTRPGQLNHRHGGRGVYFPSNDGHFLEIFTRPHT